MDVATIITSKGFRSASPNAEIGFSAGAGAAVIQTTDRATGVTINAPTGKITTDSTSLAAEASEKFVVTNSFCEINDIVVAAIRSGAIALNTRVTVTAVAAGSFTLTVVNGNAAGGTAETGALVINFAIIKGAST